jgi:hypothetical protein
MRQAVSDWHFSPLLERATVDLYRSNVFRVTGLAVGASLRDIVRQAERLQAMQKLGASLDVEGPFPLAPAPSADLIREAAQRVRDPQELLLDELFWFWPEQRGGASRDHALRALAEADCQVATELWLRRVRASEDPISYHNLAVFNHLCALEIERLPEGERQSVATGDPYWTSALQQWSAVFRHSAFWELLEDRADEIDDPRLTAEIVPAIRETLPVALLSINARFAVGASQRGDPREATRQLDFMKKSGFDRRTVSAVIDRGVAPIRSRITEMCETAESQVSADLEHADRALNHLVGHSQAPLHELACFVGQDSQVYIGASEQVALIVHKNLVDFANKTENWGACINILGECRSLARTPSTQALLDQDLKTVNEHYEETLCAFCRQRPAVESEAAKVPMYGDVRNDGLRLTWRQWDVPIRRCWPCRRVHLGRRAIAGIAGLLLGTFILWGQNSTLRATVATVAAWVGFGLIAPRANGFWRVETPSEIKKREHPLVENLRSCGWTFGRRPSSQDVDITWPVFGKFLAWFGLFIFLAVAFGQLDGDAPAAGARVRPPTATNSVSTATSGSADGEGRARAKVTDSLPTPATTKQSAISNDPTTSARQELARALKSEIDRAVAQIEKLKNEIETGKARLRSYEEELERDRSSIELFESNIKNGLGVDRDAYVRVLNRYNANIGLYKAQLEAVNSKVETHNVLLETTRAQVDQYRALTGAR